MIDFSTLDDSERDYLLGITEFSDRCSAHLIGQLIAAAGTTDEREVVLEINYLEGLSDQTRTGKPRPFTWGKLNGWWHQHFAGGLSNMAYNLKKNLPTGDSLKRIVNKEVGEPENQDDEALMDAARRIAQRLVSDQYDVLLKRRAMTGDWLIFAKHAGKNYYLAFFPHAEKGEDTDWMYDTIKSKCEDQFPFLFKD